MPYFIVILIVFFGVSDAYAEIQYGVVKPFAGRETPVEIAPPVSDEGNAFSQSNSDVTDEQDPAYSLDAAGEAEGDNPENLLPEEIAPVSRKDMVMHMRIVEKPNARFTEVKISIDTVYIYKNLRIYPKRCWIGADKGRLEHAGLVGVYVEDAGSEPHRIFAGWLFANSPSLMSLQHPYYDISLLKCLEKEPPSDKVAPENTPSH